MAHLPEGEQQAVAVLADDNGMDVRPLNNCFIGGFKPQWVYIITVANCQYHLVVDATF